MSEPAAMEPVQILDIDLFQGIAESVEVIMGKVKVELFECIRTTKRKYVRFKEYFTLLIKLKCHEIDLAKERL